MSWWLIPIAGSVLPVFAIALALVISDMIDCLAAEEKD